MTHPARVAAATAVSLLLAFLLVACGTSSVSPAPSSGALPSEATSASPAPSVRPLPTAVPRAFDEALLHRRLTVLVAGEDQSAAREASGYAETNTDALMVVSIDATQSRVVMLSLPRDTVDVPLPNGQVYHGKINAIMRTNGLDALASAVATLLDIQIDGYLKIDMDDLVTLVDAVGGIDVEVIAAVHDPQIGLSLPAGPAHLDGRTALAYTRSRVDLDYARAARQQQVVLALVRAFTDPATAWSPTSLLASMRALDTDLDLTKIATYRAIGRRSATASVVATVLQPPRFSTFVGIEPGTTRGWVMIPDVAEMRAYANELIGD